MLELTIFQLQVQPIIEIKSISNLQVCLPILSSSPARSCQKVWIHDVDDDNDNEDDVGDDDDRDSKSGERGEHARAIFCPCCANFWSVYAHRMCIGDYFWLQLC